jgi:hypothetical protein
MLKNIIYTNIKMLSINQWKTHNDWWSIKKHQHAKQAGNTTHKEENTIKQ